MAHHLILLSSTILVALLILSPPTAAASPVLDIDGNPLEAGSQYYVLTSGRGAAGRGGLTAEPDLYDGICPLYVGQYYSWTKQGSPVSFHPADPSQTQVTLGEDVNIAFGPSYVCRNQGVWQLGTTTGEVFYLTTNGVIGNASNKADWFKIEQAAFGPGSYKIVYCFATPVTDSSSQTQRSENCQQFDSTAPGPPGSDWSWLSFVPIDDPLPFFGFVFKKFTSTSTFLNPKFTTTSSYS
ncbi:miraculin-like [Chenopodium quinoa]|uniref:Uncharacterized protein n=1 Tax=Chenopodium quinoa TaxID=63459 RepID=A0A803L0P0_CHEQI|nr:miraculin-like [Chenopodium quinoa]